TWTGARRIRAGFRWCPEQDDQRLPRPGDPLVGRPVVRFAVAVRLAGRAVARFATVVRFADRAARAGAALPARPVPPGVGAARAARAVLAADVVARRAA